MSRQELYEDGIEEAKKSYVALENVLFLLLAALGFAGMYPLGVGGVPVVSILYALFVVVMLVFVLRKQLCTDCYYYGRWCHCGWGRLASAMYRKGSGNRELGGKLAGLTWGIFMGLPIIGMIVVVILGRASLVSELFLFVPFAVLVAVNGMLHTKDCGNCKMRFVCPGSAAKSR